MSPISPNATVHLEVKCQRLLCQFLYCSKPNFLLLCNFLEMLYVCQSVRHTKMFQICFSTACAPFELKIEMELLLGDSFGDFSCTEMFVMFLIFVFYFDG